MSERADRFNRLCNSAGKMLMVPMDHGISMGPLPGLVRPEDTLAQVAASASCVTVHKGIIPRVLPFKDQLGIMMHLSASTDLAPDPNDKRIIGSVSEALKLGADAVSIHLNLGSVTEADQLQSVGRITTDCNMLDVPCIGMVYPRGPGISTPPAPELVAHAARLGAEIGCDAVKVPYTGSKESFAAVVEGAGVPVIVAGGAKSDNFDDFLMHLQNAADAGAGGVSIGRNVFQAADPGAAIQAIAAIFD